MSDSPTKKISSQLSIFPFSSETHTCIGGAVQCSLFSPSSAPPSPPHTIPLSLQHHYGELTPPKQKKKIIQKWLFSLSFNPDWRGFPRGEFFFFSFCSYSLFFITSKLFFVFFLSSSIVSWSGNISQAKRQHRSQLQKARLVNAPKV